jgi:WD40 repeat protein
VRLRRWQVWDTYHGHAHEIAMALDTVGGGITACVFSPGSSVLCGGSADGGLVMWALPDVHRPEQHGPDGGAAQQGAGEPRRCAVRSVLPGRHAHAITCLAFAVCGKGTALVTCLVSGCRGGVLKLWRLARAEAPQQWGLVCDLPSGGSAATSTFTPRSFIRRVMRQTSSSTP